MMVFCSPHSWQLYFNPTPKMLFTLTHRNRKEIWVSA